MKLLHFALLAPGSPQWGLRNALRAMASEYAEFDWYPQWSNQNLRELRDGFVEKTRAMKPDFVFMQIQTENLLPGAVLDEVRRHSGFTLSWCGDCRDETPRWMWDAVGHIDLHTVSNLRDVENLRERGRAAEFLNIGFTPEVFSPQGRHRPGTPDVVFLGTNYGTRFPRSVARQKMVAGLRARYGGRFAVYGGGWGPNDPFLNEEEESASYRSCKIAINQNHYDTVPRFSSDRIFRAMGSGAFVLSNYWPGIEEEFSDGEHLVVWRDFDELHAKIDYYLAHDDERHKIAAAGTEHVRRNHTWEARMRNIQTFLSQAAA